VLNALVGRQSLHEVAVMVEPAPGLFGGVTRILTLVPRFIVVNRCDIDISYRQYIPDRRIIPSASETTLPARRQRFLLREVLGYAARCMLEKEFEAGTHRRLALRKSGTLFMDAFKRAFGPD